MANLTTPIADLRNEWLVGTLDELRRVTNPRLRGAQRETMIRLYNLTRDIAREALKAKAEEDIDFNKLFDLQRRWVSTLRDFQVERRCITNQGGTRAAGLAFRDNIWPCNRVPEIQNAFDGAMKKLGELEQLQQRKQDIEATEDTVIAEQVTRTLEDIQESQQTIEQRQARLGEARQLLNELTMTESAKARDGTSQLAEDLTKTLSKIQKQLESQGKVEKSTAEQAKSKADKLAENASDSDTAEKAKQAIDEATGTGGGETAEATQDLKLGKIGQFVKDRPVVSAGAGLLALRLLMGR